MSLFAQAADGLPARGTAFGEQAGNGLAGQAGSIGAEIGHAAGASIVQAAAGIRIGVDAPKSVPNTGSPPPPE